MIPRQAAAAQPALVAGWSENHLRNADGHIQVQRAATPAYLSRHLQPRKCVHLWSSDTPQLCQPSPKLTSSDVVSVTQLVPSGTNFLEQYSKAHQYLSLNPGLRLAFLIWLISNSNDVNCATSREWFWMVMCQRGCVVSGVPWGSGPLRGQRSRSPRGQS